MIHRRAGEITDLLRTSGRGDEAALIRPAEQIRPELRRMARRYMNNEAAGDSPRSTALVRELYLRLVDVAWRKGSRRRSGLPVTVNLDDPAVLSSAAGQVILALDDAPPSLSQLPPRQAKVVGSRYFGGLTEGEIEAALKISRLTIRRDWDLVKAWLRREPSDSAPGPSGQPA